MGEFSQFALIPEQGVVPQIEQLDEQMRGRIAEMAGRLNIRDHAAVMGFGAKAQKDMNAFTSIALDRMLREDVKPLSGVMQTLSEQIRACSFTAQAQGLLRRMFGAPATLDQVRSAYEKAEPHINRCADEMTDRRVALMHDSALLDRLYERNEELYRELCSLIVVGEEALRQAKARGEEAPVITRMERRVQDIRVTQMASTQLAAQIRAVQASDELTCQKLQAALETTIPLWKSQMLTALGMARATDSMAMQRRFSEEAKRGIRRSAQDLTEQKDAFVREAAKSDRERAQQTAEDLLQELEQIEQSLQAQDKARRGTI